MQYVKGESMKTFVYRSMFIESLEDEMAMFEEMGEEGWRCVEWNISRLVVQA